MPAKNLGKIGEPGSSTATVSVAPLTSFTSFDLQFEFAPFAEGGWTPSNVSPLGFNLGEGSFDFVGQIETTVSTVAAPVPNGYNILAESVHGSKTNQTTGGPGSDEFLADSFMTSHGASGLFVTETIDGNNPLREHWVCS